MPTSTSGNTVQIVINVVDANSGEVISRVTKNVDALGTAGSKAGTGMATGLNAAGEAGTRAGKKVGEGFKEMSGHALTSLDNVRLLRDDLGIRIPRSMEVAIARSKALSTVIGGIGSGLLALGSLELAFHVGKEAWELYDKLTDVNKEVRKYQEGAAQASAQKLFAAGDIETQLANLRQINAEVGKLQAQQRADIKAGPMGFVDQFQQRMNNRSGFAQAMDYTGVGYIGQAVYHLDKTYDDRQQRDQNLAQRLQDKYDGEDRTFATRQAAEMERLRGSIAARTARVTGAAVDRSEEQGRIEIAALTMRQTQNLNTHNMNAYDAHVGELTQGMRDQHKSADDIAREVASLGARPTKDPNAGLERFQDEQFAAQEMGSAKAATRARTEREEVARARDEANQAGLQGEARFHAQYQAMLDGFQRREDTSGISHEAARQLRAAAREKFDNEVMERRRSQLRETERMEAEAGAAGATGIRKTDLDLQLRLSRIDQAENDTTLDPDQAARQRTAARATALKEQQRQVDDFSEHVSLLETGRANSSMTANQRILADSRRMLAELDKTYKNTYGDIEKQNPNDPRLLAGRRDLQAGQASVNNSAAEEMGHNNRQIADETRKLQMEAGRGGGGNPFAQRGMEVRAQEQDQMRAVQEREDAAARAGELDAVREFEAQKLAIQQIANNKELDLAREQRDKLAGALQGFFANPLEALKRQGEGIASKAAADLFLGRKPGVGDGSGGIFDGIIGGIGGGRAGSIVRPTFGRNRGLPAGRGEYEAGAPQIAAPQVATVNAGSAVINVSNASFTGAGGSISGGNYASTGNGGYFNLGSSPSSSGSGNGEMGSAASGGASSSPFSDLGDASGFGGAATGVPGSTGFGSSVTGAYSDIQGGFSQANSLGRDLGIFGKDANGNNAGLMSKIPGIKNMTPETLGKLGGVAGGALGVFSAFEGKGGIMGGLQGAASGASAGMQYGGPVGAALGAVVGGLLGFMGHGARVQAQKYWWKEVRPKVDAEMLGFEAGTADYQGVYDDITKSDTEAKQKTREMGSGAMGYYDDTIHPGLQKYLQRLTREQKAGRQQFGMSAAQFHLGGPIGAFGSMATGDGQGWIHAQQGEFVLNQRAAMSHADVASMMNAGTSRADIAEYMGSSPAPQRAAVSGGDVHLHLDAIDGKGAYDFLLANKHKLREALNSSYAENSGGGD